MTTRFSSTFPGTYGDALENNGEGFVRHPTTSTYVHTYSNSARQPDTLPSEASSIYTRPGIAGLELAHEVSVDLDAKTILTNTNSIGVLIACDATLFTTYIGYYQPNIGKLRIAKRINGTETVLREMDYAATAGTMPRMRFRREWDDTTKNTLSLFIDDVSMFTPVVDTSITVIGSPGIRRYDSTGSSDTTGIHYKNFSVDTLDAGSPDATATGGTGTSTGSGSGGDAVGASGGDATVTGGTGTGTGSGTGGDATGESAATGTFAAGPLENSPGSQWLNQAVVWTWTPSGRVGSMAGKTPVDGTGTTHATTGILTVSGLTAGSGKLDISVLGATPADDIVYTQYGTVS